MRFYCVDGHSLSVVAGHGAYSRPRHDEAEYYTHVEVGFVRDASNRIVSMSSLPSDFHDYYDDCDDVYAYVPIEIVDAFVSAHGGLSDIVRVNSVAMSSDMLHKPTPKVVDPSATRDVRRIIVE